MALRNNIRSTLWGVPRVALGVVIAAVVGIAAINIAAADTPGTTLFVTPINGLADTANVTVSGTGFSAGASVGISQCKTNASQTPVSCVPGVGSAFTDAGGSFSGVSVTVNRNFVATQGATGAIDCGPEDLCGLFADDPGNKSDHQMISFASIVPAAPPVLTVVPNSGLGDAQSVNASGTNFSVGATVTFYECKYVGDTAQSCGVVGNGVLSDENGNFGPTSVPVTRVFTATQGVTGTIDCRPEDSCRLVATDAGGREDNAPISFDSVANPPTTTTSTTVLPTTTTTSTTLPPNETTTTTTPPPPISATCNALLSSKERFNATIDAFENLLPGLNVFWELQRSLGNAAFNAALRLNNCDQNADFTQLSKAKDQATMRRILPASVFKALQNPTSIKAPTTVTPKTYTVQPGDTLSKIAKNLLGSAAKYPLLVKANPSLAANPSLIRPGQVLVIPG